MKRRVVVTGLGVVTSLSCKVDELWTRLCNGESGIRHIRGFDRSRFRSQISGEVFPWSSDGYIEPREAKRLDRFTQFAVVGAIDAIRDSGIEFDKEDPYRCGVILGTGIGGLYEIEVQHSRLLEKGPDKVSAFTIPKLMANAASAQVSIQFGLRGPNAAVSTACARASNAIGDAMKLIQYDEADVVVTGGTEAAVTPMGISAFGAMRASERNDDPAGSRLLISIATASCLPGSRAARARGTGARPSRGAQIFGEVLACGVSADGSHITQPDKDGIGGGKAMELAASPGAGRSHRCGLHQRPWHQHAAG